MRILRTLVCVMLSAAVSTRCSQDDQLNGSISGTVRDVGTGRPAANVPVSAVSGSAEAVTAISDAQGRYSLAGIAPGQVRVTAGAIAESSSAKLVASRVVNLAPGRAMRQVDLLVQGIGLISGRVTDEEGNPLAGVTVVAFSREYSLGAIRYVAGGSLTTDQDGNYGATSSHSAEERSGSDDVNRSRKENPSGIPLDSGREYLLWAMQFRVQPSWGAPAHEELADPKPSDMLVRPAWYIDSTFPEGATPVILMPGESREHADVRMRRAPAYCMQGTPRVWDPSQPGSAQMTIASVMGGLSWGLGGMSWLVRGDPSFRICNLPPGDYRVTAAFHVGGSLPLPSGIPPGFARAEVTIKDRHVTDMALTPEPVVAVAGEVVWDKDRAETAAAESLSLQIRPLSHAPLSGETTKAKVTVPGRFSLGSLVVEDYALEVNGVPAGAYLKDITCGGRSILHAPLAVGSATNLRIVLGRDGGRVVVQVVDGDGKAVADAHVVVVPEDAGSPAVIAEAMVNGKTDLSGTWSSGLLAPGRYHAIASQAPVNKSPESIGRLVRSLGKAKKIEIGPGAVASVQVAAAEME